MPAWPLVCAAWAGLTGQRRPLLADARRVLAQVPPVCADGLDLLPAAGPFVLAANHYSRPGLGVWWGVMALSVQLPAAPRWVTAAAWTAPGARLSGAVELLTGWAFGRMARVYGFFAMPPMPPRPADAARRAAVVRAALMAAKESPGLIVGIMPEGRDIPGGGLGWPPDGAGRFLQGLSTRLGTVVPAGVYEQHGQLCLRFGSPFALPADLGRTAAQQDHEASREVMSRIAALLPQAMRGPF